MNTIAKVTETDPICSWNAAVGCDMGCDADKTFSACASSCEISKTCDTLEDECAISDMVSTCVCGPDEIVAGNGDCVSAMGQN